MDPKFTVYSATSPCGKKYIGCTSVGLPARKRQHEHSVKRFPHYKFYRAIAKYGIDAFEWSVLAVFHDEKEMHQEERRLIAVLGTQRHGYNIVSGGEGAAGRKNSPEQNAKHGERQRKRFTNPDERERTRLAQVDWIKRNPEDHKLAAQARNETLRSDENRRQAY